jgi:hypothetical protein
MPILLQCQQCQRKLRVQDNLLGKTIKCPGCQTRIVVQAAAADAPAAPETNPRTPALAPTEPESPTPTLTAQMLEISEPASAPATPTVPPRSAERIAPAPVVPRPEPPPVTPPAVPVPFETSPFKVFTVIAGLLLLTAVAAAGVGWWLGTAVESAAAASSDKP